GRHPARAPEEASPPPRRAGRRPALLVHDHGLDDVELSRGGPSLGGIDRSLRRESGPPRPRDALGSRRRGRDHHLRDERRLHRGLPEGGRGAAGRPRSLAPGQRRLHGVAARSRRIRLGAQPPRRGRLALLHLRRHRRLHRVRRRRADAAGLPRRAAGARARSERRGPERGRGAGGSGGRVGPGRGDGRPLAGEVGELVIPEPMPSMPLYLWGDEDGSRYRESYFSTFPGVWRHGDWIEITERGTAIITGRSDATINRGGVRMGTSELYRSVLALDAVVDALVVDVPQGDGSRMTLFVVLREGAALNEGLEAEIR